jgi:copper oxidase (laccase) domain-containing protein
MAREWATDPASVFAALGPSAGPCCYEVGPEIAGKFHPSAVQSRHGRLYADLHTEIRERLIASGMRSENIESIPDCTVCHTESYFSHRRDGRCSGRMMGYIMIKESA